MADNTLSIVIPTYNEKDNVTPLVERLHRALAGRKYEIVFVDDNSRDGTAQAAAALAPTYPVRVIVRTNERGLASAVVHGFRNTSSGIIAVMDADLQHPPEVVAELLKSIEGGRRPCDRQPLRPGRQLRGVGPDPAHHLQGSHLSRPSPVAPHPRHP